MNHGFQEVNDYLESNKWKSHQENDETRIYYKGKDLKETTSREFLTYSKAKKRKDFYEILNQIKTAFRIEGYELAEPSKIIRGLNQSTFFVTSGIQHYEDYFSKGIVPDTNKSLFVQPVIRTSREKGPEEGSASSFINISGIKCNSSIKDYISGIDLWMNVLSNTGLYLGNFNLRLKQRQPKQEGSFWDKKKGVTLSFNYGDLRLGDAGFFIIPGQEEKPVIDLGFGLERIIWAINKDNSFMEVIAPFPYFLNKNSNYPDAIRTTTLMLVAGLDKSNMDAFNQFRKYISHAAEKNGGTKELFDFYFDFWSKFTKPVNSKEESWSNLKSEINRARNIALLSKLGCTNVPAKLNESINLNENEFFNLLESNFVDIRSRIRTIDNLIG